LPTRERTTLADRDEVRLNRLVHRHLNAAVKWADVDKGWLTAPSGMLTSLPAPFCGKGLPPGRNDAHIRIAPVVGHGADTKSIDNKNVTLL
jgi:hypothetical protein